MFHNRYLIPFAVVIKHWKLKPLQLVLLLLGLTTATALWNAVHLINDEAKKAYSDAQILSTISAEKIIISKNDNDFNDKYFGELRKQGWLVTPQLHGVLDHNSYYGKTSIQVIGLDPLSANKEKIADAFQVALDFEEFLNGTRAIVAAPKTANIIRTLIKFESITVSQSLPEGFAITDISIAQRILNKKNKLSNLQIVGQIPKNQRPLNTRGLKLTINDTNADLEKLTESFHLNLTAFGLLSYIVGLFIVYSTINLAFEQRKGLLKGLRSLGLSSISVTGLMLLEILLMSSISGIFGVILSFFLATTLLPDVATTLNGLFGANVKSSLSIDFMFWLSSIVISSVGAMCAALPTLVKVSSLSPIDSAKKIAWYYKTKTNLKYQLGMIAILVCLTMYFINFGTGIVDAFLLLGTTLVSATLMLPIFLWFTLSIILKYNFKTPLIKWFFADSKQQINSLSVSLMALLIALAINIGIGGMVGSFRKTFDGWLDQRLASELYIRTSNATISKNLKNVLDGKVQAILPIVKVSKNIHSLPTDLYGFMPHETYESNWPLIMKHSNTWKELKKNKGLIINEQMARKLDLTISQTIEFESKMGAKIRLKVLGVYSDYGNPKGQLMMPLGLFNEYFPDKPALSFALRVPTQTIPQIRKLLNTTFSQSEISITDQTEIKNLSRRIFEKTFSITRALSILTLGIAGIALFTSITALGDNRNSQLAPLWSIGTKRRTLALLETLRALSLSGLTFLFALPLGLTVVFILTNYVNLQAFGWKLPIFYFPMQWIYLFLLTLLMTIFATCFHAFKLSKTHPAELLKAAQYET